MTLKQIAAEHRATVASKQAKLAALIASGKSDADIVWGREWEGDTRIKTIAQAKAEIEHFVRRAEAAEANAA